jgi:hypothetical protein
MTLNPIAMAVRVACGGLKPPQCRMEINAYVRGLGPWGAHIAHERVYSAGYVRAG